MAEDKPRSFLGFTQKDGQYVGTRMVFGAASLGLGAMLVIGARKAPIVGDFVEGADQIIAGIFKGIIRPFIRGEGVTPEARDQQADQAASAMAAEVTNNFLEFGGGLTAMVAAMKLLGMPLGYRPGR